MHGVNNNEIHTDFDTFSLATKLWELTAEQSLMDE